MRVRRALGLFLVLILGSSTSVLASPMKPNVEEMLKRQVQGEPKYSIARIGWDPVAFKGKPFNPIYESMSYRLSPEALQQQLLLIAMPNLSVLISIFGIIFLLRMMRRERERNANGRAEVIAMPTRASEAA
jgi:hypothetical protein